MNVLLFVLGIVIVGTLGYDFGWQTAVAGLREDAGHQLDSYVGALTSELNRYGYLPAVIALNGTVQRVVLHPDDPRAVLQANRFLEAANREADAAAVYVMDLQGKVLAASNWRTNISFVGKDFAFRPYFREAKAGRTGRFYGIGTVSHAPGLFFSRPLSVGGRIIGVIATKVSLGKLVLPWLGGRDPILVADGNGIVFLTSVPKWRFESLDPLPPATIRHLTETRQYYAAAPLKPIGLVHVGKAGEASLVDAPPIDGGPGNKSRATEFLLSQSPVPKTDWQILLLSDLRPVAESAHRIALALAALMGLGEALALLLLQRRRSVADRLLAREALEAAYNELEQKVVLRTRDLREANSNLQREIDERQRAESELSSTFEELAHASKMAALGQMATEVAHELNQPLAALHTLSDNAIVFLNQSREEEARGNLAAIARLVRRMAKITGDLKVFARKAPPKVEPVIASEALNDALSLLGQRLDQEKIALAVHFPEDEPPVMGDKGRLQQVLVILLSNAADALRDVPDKRIDIFFVVEAPALGESVRYAELTVADTGTGLSASDLERLFQPFFTTKPQGGGLGLGLAIAQGILRGFDASIKAGNRAGGGAEFTVRLRLAKETGRFE